MSNEEKQISPKPAPHIKFITWDHFMEWARYEGLIYKSENGLRQAFKRKGGTYGKAAGAIQAWVPVPVVQVLLYFGGYEIPRSKNRPK